MIRSATATWCGDAEAGAGEVTAGSWSLKASRYAQGTRFGGQPGTNPEELIAAAHASCFNLSMARRLQGAGYAAIELSTQAEVTLADDGAGYRIARATLDLVAVVPGLDDATFASLAAEAGRDCLVSRLLNADVALQARLT